MTISIIEVRNYLIKPGMREHFIDYFEAVLVDQLEAFGMTVLGQFRNVEDPDRFVFMRGFKDMQTRLRSLEFYYEGPVWEKFGPAPNSMMLEWHNVHLLRPLDGIDGLMCGQSTQGIAAALADGSISPETGAVGVDIYKAAAGKRDELVDRFRAEVVPAYSRESIQLRGLFVAEMGLNEFPRLPVIQDPDELVVITTYERLDICREQRGRVGKVIGEAADGLLGSARESLLLTPTLRSPLRYMPD